MDILIQTKDHIYSLSWKNGIRKVETVNWNKLKASFDSLLSFQTENAKVHNEQPVFKQLDETVAAGCESARDNAAAWRQKKRSEVVVNEGFWEKEESGNLDRTHRALRNQKLQPQ